MTNTVTLSHGNGGQLSNKLINELIGNRLSQKPQLENDAALLPALQQPLCMTTDSYTVQPLQFPGGSIGSLAIHGTVNDLAVSGARARYLSLSIIIEEGFALSQLETIIDDINDAACDADVHIICGDTKVVPRGEAGGIYLNTCGIGEKIIQHHLGLQNIQPGDQIISSGTLGDHGATIMLAREEFGLHSQLCSDSANVFPLVEKIAHIDGLRFMRDPTRGGLSSVIYDIYQGSNLGITLEQSHLPLRPEVRSLCEILGLEPWHLASEGRIIAVVAANHAEQLLALWRQSEHGRDAVIIGEISQQSHLPQLRTSLGGSRILAPLEDDPLPRIC